MCAHNSAYVLCLCACVCRCGPFRYFPVCKEICVVATVINVWEGTVSQVQANGHCLPRRSCHAGCGQCRMWQWRPSGVNHTHFTAIGWGCDEVHQSVTPYEAKMQIYLALLVVFSCCWEKRCCSVILLNVLYVCGVCKVNFFKWDHGLATSKYNSIFSLFLWHTSVLCNHTPSTLYICMLSFLSSVTWCAGNEKVTTCQ